MGLLSKLRGQVGGVRFKSRRCPDEQSGRWASQGEVRQAGSRGESRGHHGVSHWVSGRQAVGVSRGGAMGCAVG